MKLNRLSFALLAAGFSSAALAAAPFSVQDIRVEGLQRTEPATVFAYMPVQIGGTFTDGTAERIIKDLYATGLFEDVRVETSGRQVLLTVVERPTISNVSVNGGKVLPNDAIKRNLDSMGIGQAHPFNPTLLAQAVSELEREYSANHGKYGAQVRTEIARLSNNRVDIVFNIDEGDTTRIENIEFEGNEAFSDWTLSRRMQLSEKGLFSWLTKDDRFSDDKFRQDLEAVTNFYQNEGYFEGRVVDADVRFNEDRTRQTLWVKVHEGPVYRWGKVSITGDTKEVPPADLEALLKMKNGRSYDREQMTKSLEAIQRRMGESGYAFAQVIPQPIPDAAAQTVDFVLHVNAGRKVNVRRININGNNRTRDEVIRRELRQMEAAPYDAARVQRSRERVQLLGYFEDLDVQTIPVEEAPDQVDIDLTVKERHTGSVEISAGWIQDTGLVLSAGISQDNLFGTGKSVGARIARGKTQNTVSLSFTDPYFTAEGVSMGYDVYYRGFTPYKSENGNSANNYSTIRYGAGLRMGVPVTEYDRVHFGLGVERLTVGVHGRNRPQRYVDYIRDHGERNWIFKGNIGWGRNTTDDAVWPTRGYITNVNAEIGLPGSGLQYYTLTHDQRWFFPVSRDFTLMLGADFGYAGSYGRTKTLPFFHNFYGGGLNSVRGYESGTLGPKVNEAGSGGNSIASYGGRYKASATAELLFPLPGIKNQRSVRLSVFADAASVWDGKTYTPASSGGFYRQNHRSTFGSELRYSAGAAFTWLSPMGPLKFSYAYPLNRKPGDQIQRFQFQLGTTF